MAYISKLDTKFVTFINRKYKRYKVDFEYFDDYILWLYYDFCKCNEEFYYTKLEEDVWAYSDWQTGSPRENEIKNGDWKSLDKEDYRLHGSEKYIEFLKKVAWKK